MRSGEPELTEHRQWPAMETIENNFQGLALNDRQQTLMQAILMNRTLSDIQLEVRTDATDHTPVLPVHSLVLRTKSEVFNAMLEPGRYKEGRSNRVVIEGFKFENVRRFIEFLYVEKLPRIKWSDTLELFRISHYYQVYDLMTVVLTRINSQLEVDNAMEVLELAERCSVEPLAGSALQVLAKGAFVLFDQNMHVDASKEALIALISMDTLNVEDERQVLRALWVWAEWCCWRQNLDPTEENIVGNITQEMLGHVRWTEELDQMLELCGSSMTFPIKVLRAALSSVHCNQTSPAEAELSDSSEPPTPIRLFNYSPNLMRYCDNVSIINNCTFSPLDFMFPAASSECIVFSLDRDVYLIAIEFFILAEKGLFPELKDHLSLQIINMKPDMSIPIKDEIPVEYRYSYDQRSGQTYGKTWYWSSTVTAEMVNVVRLRRGAFYIISLSKICNAEKIIYHKHARRHFNVFGVGGLQLLTHSQEVHAVQKLFYITCCDK